MGLTEAQAKEKYGDKVETFTYDLAGNGKSQILKTQGFVKLVRAPDGPVVGIHMVGGRVSELVGEAQLIYNWEAYPADVAAARSTATRPRTRRSARRTSRWPASRCTSTADRARPDKESSGDAGIGHHAPARRERHRGHRHPLAEAGGRPRRGRRAAARGLHRQGRHRDPVAGRRRAVPHRRGRGRDGRGRQRARGHRRRRRERGRRRAAAAPRRPGAEQQDEPEPSREPEPAAEAEPEPEPQRGRAGARAGRRRPSRRRRRPRPAEAGRRRGHARSRCRRSARASPRAR